MCKLIQRNVKCHPEVNKMLYAETAKREVSAITTLDGVKVKIRPDMVDEKKLHTLNIKTTQDCRDFRRDAIKFYYDAQAAFYLDACASILSHNNKDNIRDIEFIHYWLIIEKTPPFGIVLYGAYMMDLAWGRKYYKKGLKNKRYLEQTELNYYPGYTKEIVYTGEIRGAWRDYDRES